MKRRQIIVVALLAVASYALASDSEPVRLKRTAKVGDFARYRVNGTSGSLEQPVTISSVVRMRVTWVGKDGSVTVESSFEKLVATMAGKELVTSGPDMVSRVTYEPSGQVVDIKQQLMASFAYRAANLNTVFWPKREVRAGWKWSLDSGLEANSSWTVRKRANSEKGTVDVVCKYKILERKDLHGYDCFRIRFEHTEATGGAWSKGEIWIDVETGLTVMQKGTNHGIPPNGTAIDQEYQMEIIN